MVLDLNKFYNLGTLTKSQVDENWDDIEGFSVPANTAEVRGMSAEKVMMPKGIGDALAWETITFAASLSLNGNNFVQGDLILTGACELITPTNFTVGTKYLMVRGNNATPRTLTFNADFKGELPTLIDITNAKWYLLSIVAYSSSHYIVSAVQAL